MHNKIRDCVNNFKSTFHFADKPFAVLMKFPCDMLSILGEAGAHWGPIEKFFSKSMENVFVFDFTKPRAALDSAYPVVKQMAVMGTTWLKRVRALLGLV